MDSAARGPLMLLVVDGSVGEGCVAVQWLDGASAGRLESAAAATPLPSPGVEVASGGVAVRGAIQTVSTCVVRTSIGQ